MRKCAVYLIMCIAFSLVSCGEGVEKRVETTDDGMITVEYYVKKRTDIKHGPLIRREKDGTLLEESHYVDGRLNGEKRLYYKGKLYSVMHYINDTPHGKFISYFQGTDVVHQEGQYVRGKMEGKWKTYYPSGKLKEVVTFKDNEENGPFVEYYDNGKIKAEGTYKDGDNEHGLLLLYNPFGVLYKKMQCDHGKCRTIWIRHKGNVEGEESEQ